MKNLDIRKAIEQSNFKYWQVADKLGMTDSNFSRMLRFELKDKEKEHIFKIINELNKEDSKWKKNKST